ncbi:sulfate reduction electron transfer complex DsrMKJOP subunit DsrJ [Desulfovibrio inopinatus]|uniref:sulfate reduction electron transfer complex DsrMKJOP subunit DsrJ n=1 Tax=Desulfovibrio inopinatus TaxID=102109 RepID=UPI0004272DE4|nr:sulfate reduction electron transfer complex DsrMKJOP subunit DsrJ [Desulfovibrio inopinatus]
MYNAKYIVPGLLVFLALVLMPFFFKGDKDFDVKLELPKDVKQCVMATEWMRTSHMQLLNEWRTEVIRDGERIFVNAEGKEYSKSLTNTCMRCHDNKEKFCDQCHNAVGVAPYCWDCHNTSPTGANQ